MHSACWRAVAGVNFLWYMDGIKPAGRGQLSTVGGTDWHLEQ